MILDILIIIWLHFIADFVLQSNWVAQNKSSYDTGALELHVIVYAIPFLYFGWVYAVLNAVLHYATDYLTSRETKRLWADGQVHNFFVVIGLDQAIHMTTLIATYWWLIL